MPQKAREEHEAWKRADAEARAAEDRFRQAWKRYNELSGPQPSDELIKEVDRLRRAADDQLLAALSALSSLRR
jgi:ferric-dicitrate binding protein FerR (iron transport regulator)